jgi:membrane protein YqaA with SNARE-associated domain
MSTSDTAAINPSPEKSGAVKSWHYHRRLYDWVLHWAETPYGVPALFVIAFVESSFFPIPPDLLLIALVLGVRKQWFKFALTCTLGSALGGLFGYSIGYLLMDSIGMKILDFYHAQDYFIKVTDWYQAYDYWIVFAAAFTPIPYKVFTIASGAFNMNILGFFIVSVVGRGLRFFAVAGLLFWFGPTIKTFIEKYFNLLSLAFLAVLVLGFLAVSYL